MYTMYKCELMNCFVYRQCIDCVLFSTRKNVNASINAMLIDDGGLFLAALVDNGGCQVRKATGVFFWINSHSQQWTISSNLCKFLLPSHALDFLLLECII